MLSLDLLLLITLFAALMAGYPVGLTLGGVSILFGLIAWVVGQFDPVLFYAIPSRLFGIMTNQVLLSVPLFIFMGLVLERSRIAEDMLSAMGQLTRELRGGLTISVTLVGMVLAASTGVAGASVATLGLLALPTMLRFGISPALAGGSVAAAGTLGQIIPPSIVLIILGDQISNAWQKMQSDAGNFAPETVSIADLFAGALLPGLILIILYVLYQFTVSRKSGTVQTDFETQTRSGAQLVVTFLPPMVLVLLVLGSILCGVATPSEAASVGAVGALVLARNRLDRTQMRTVLEGSTHLVAMIFLIVIGASLFSLVFRGLGGEETINAWLADLPGGTYSALFIVMLVIFVLGFFLEFIEITLVVIPLVAPVLLAMPMADGSPMSPVWLGVLVALNLQTSFLTPPFGVSLFYLRSVAPPEIDTITLYRGVVPFVGLQLLTLAIVMMFPVLATFLPNLLYGS